MTRRDRDQVAALRAAGALQMCVLDRRYDDAKTLIAGLDATVLRATTLELAIIWAEAAAFLANRADMRDAVEKDALHQALIDDDHDA